MDGVVDQVGGSHTSQSAAYVDKGGEGMASGVIRSRDSTQKSHQMPSGRWRTLAASVQMQKYSARSSR